MANKFRGEVEIDIAGKTYAVAMTLEALALAADALGIETLEEFEARMRALRIGDMRPMLAALLKGNGHDVPEADLATLHYSAYPSFLARVYGARPGNAEAVEAADETDPPKRAARPSRATSTAP